MITPLELRMQYKFDTGKKSLYYDSGDFTQDYMRWLEPKNYDRSREKYQQETGKNPILKDSRRKYNRPGFINEYGEWLEEIQCTLSNAII